MILRRKIIEETGETRKATFEFEMFNGKHDDDRVKVECYQTQITLADAEETLINLGLSKYAKVHVTVTIDVDNAPDNGM